jgi:hypothetical protein
MIFIASQLFVSSEVKQMESALLKQQIEPIITSVFIWISSCLGGLSLPCYLNVLVAGRIKLTN